MKNRLVTLPDLFLIAGTRVALGAGVGLLLADRLTPEQRRAVGWTLLGVGAVTTIPLAAKVLSAGADQPTSGNGPAAVFAPGDQFAPTGI